VREEQGEDGEDSIEMVTSVPDESAPLRGEALDRERAVLAARAGLDDPGPSPEHGDVETAGLTEPLEEEEDGDRTDITSDRGALLRLFSGLRDQG
jgi:hypothetical protein